MMKSILDLLREEDELVRSIREMRLNLKWYRDMLKEINAINIECDARNDDIRNYNYLVNATEKAIVSACDKLVHIRKQIRVMITGVKL